MSPNKEPNFFAYQGENPDCQGPGADFINNATTRLEDYRQLFDRVSGEKAVGEASPLYLYSEKAPARIRQLLPDAKLIAVLRSPVEQAWSHFLYAKRHTIEPLEDFSAALDAEAERARMGWQPLFQYSRFPAYCSQLTRYYEQFPEEQLRVFLYEDFRDDPRGVLAEIHRFLGVDPGFETDTSARPNAGGVPRNAELQSLVMRPSRLTWLAGKLLPEAVKSRLREAVSDRNLERPELPAEARAKLLERLEPEIRGLQDLLGRDLSGWLD